MGTHPQSFLQATIHYFRRDLGDELESFGRWARYYLPLFIAAAVVVAVLFAYLSVATSNKAVLGYGQLGSSYRSLAEDYKQFFEKNGLRLELSHVAHLGESVDQLQRDSAPLNASFVVAGSTLNPDARTFVSLGSLKFAPGWLFYRGPALDGANPFVALAGKRMAVGPPGSFSSRVLRELQANAAPPGTDAMEIRDLTDGEGVVALLKGDVDALWIIDSADSENIQTLISREDIQLFSWELADAYISRIPYLSKLTLPAGYFDVGNARPPKNLTLLSTTVTLLVEADLHPALQWGFLLAARDYQSSHYDDLSAGVAFPKYLDKSVPLSPVAERYFNDGVPIFFSYLPIFYASLVERIWIWIAALFVVGYPMFRVITKFRKTTSKWASTHASRQKRRAERWRYIASEEPDAGSK